MLMNPDLILSEARRLAIEAKEERDRDAQEDSEEALRRLEDAQARHEQYLQVAPALINRASREHSARFAPLQELLNRQVSPAFKAIRDELFPGSRLFYTQFYERMFGKGRWNLYHQALMMFVGYYQTTSVLAFHAIGIELAPRSKGRDWSLYPQDRMPKPTIQVLVTEHYPPAPNEENLSWLILYDSASRADKDFEVVSKPSKLLRVGYSDDFISTEEGQSIPIEDSLTESQGILGVVYDRFDARAWQIVNERLAAILSRYIKV